MLEKANGGGKSGFQHEYFTEEKGEEGAAATGVFSKPWDYTHCRRHLVNVIKKTLCWETQSISVQDIQSCCGLFLPHAQGQDSSLPLPHILWLGFFQTDIHFKIRIINWYQSLRSLDMQCSLYRLLLSLFIKTFLGGLQNVLFVIILTYFLGKLMMLVCMSFT